MTRLSISILIPTYNRAVMLKKTLQSISRIDSLTSHDAEVIVVDNNSPDNTLKTVQQLAKAYPVPLRCVRETTQGLNFGRNRGAKEAHGEHLAYLDDDIQVEATWLNSYCEAVNEFDADCVVGPVTPSFMKPPPSYLTERVIASLSSLYSRHGDEVFLIPAESSHQVPGCNFAVRREAIETLKGFHPKLDRSGTAMLAGGDTEFGLRLRKSGKRVVYHPGCGIQHIIPPAKFDQTYLRRRWSGLGATERILHTMHPWFACDRPRRNHLRGMVLAARRWVTADDNAIRFQRELEVRRHWAYLTYKDST